MAKLLAAYRESHDVLLPASAITPAQARAARVGLGMSIEGVTTRAEIQARAVANFEGNGIGDRILRRNLRETLELAGAGFVADGGLAAVVFHV